MEPDGRRIFTDFRLASGSIGEGSIVESWDRKAVAVKSGEKKGECWRVIRLKDAVT